jgi:hypothetical protein
MSAPGLQHFLDGGEPQKPTARKLVEWYVREAATRRELDAETAAAAFFLLVDSLPAGEQEAARRRIVDAVRLRGHGARLAGRPTAYPPR